MFEKEKLGPSVEFTDAEIEEIRKAAEWRLSFHSKLRRDYSEDELAREAVALESVVEKALLLLFLRTRDSARLPILETGLSPQQWYFLTETLNEYQPDLDRVIPALTARSLFRELHSETQWCMVVAGRAHMRARAMGDGFVLPEAKREPIYAELRKELA